jgi:hypothetical protein
MNKIYYILFLFLLGCTNPSMEDGMSKLSNSLAELAKAIESLNIPKWQEDLQDINEEATQILYDLEDAEGSWQISINLIEDIRIKLQNILNESNDWATSQQMDSLLVQIQEFGEGIDELVLRADYDYDGVLNGLDRCPDTPLTKINQVDFWGCAPGEIPITSTNSTTTVTQTTN